MYVVYMLQHSIRGDFYIGRTSSLEKRLKSHNNNLNRSTRRNSGCWVLVYAEAYRSRSDAIRRELKLKQHGSSKRELLKRIQESAIEIKSEAG